MLLHPSKDSLYFDPDTFSNLESEVVNNFQKFFSFILAADFNARTGVERDFLVDKNSKSPPHLSQMTRRRQKSLIISLTTVGHFYSKCVNPWISGSQTGDVKVTPSVKEPFMDIKALARLIMLSLVMMSYNTFKTW